MPGHKKATAVHSEVASQTLQVFTQPQMSSLDSKRTQTCLLPRRMLQLGQKYPFIVFKKKHVMALC